MHCQWPSFISGFHFIHNLSFKFHPVKISRRMIARVKWRMYTYWQSSNVQPSFHTSVRTLVEMVILNAFNKTIYLVKGTIYFWIWKYVIFHIFDMCAVVFFVCPLMVLHVTKCYIYLLINYVTWSCIYTCKAVIHFWFDIKFYSL